MNTREYEAIFTNETWVEWSDHDIAPAAYLRFKKEDAVNLGEMI